MNPADEALEALFTACTRVLDERNALRAMWADRDALAAEINEFRLARAQAENATQQAKKEEEQARIKLQALREELSRVEGSLAMGRVDVDRLKKTVLAACVPLES